MQAKPETDDTTGTDNEHTDANAEPTGEVVAYQIMRRRIEDVEEGADNWHKAHGCRYIYRKNAEKRMGQFRERHGDVKEYKLEEVREEADA